MRTSHRTMFAAAGIALVTTGCQEPTYTTVINRTDTQLYVSYQLDDVSTWGFVVDSKYTGSIIVGTSCLTTPPAIEPAQFAKPLRGPLRLNLPWCLGTKKKPTTWIIEYAPTTTLATSG